MNQEIIPKSLRNAFSQFTALKSDEEKLKFWKEMARNKDQFAPGTLDMQIQKGLIALSDRVDELLKKAKQPV